MSILDTIRRWLQQEQIHWTLVPIAAPAGLPVDADRRACGIPVETGTSYLKIHMRSMSITATRRLWNVFHAALYSQVTLGLRNGTKAEIQAVLSPDFFRNLDPRRLQNVLMIDRTVFGPVPYAGGSLTTRMGVFAVKDADLATPFLGAVTSLASAAGVAYVAMAQPFIGPIKEAIELLAGAADATSLEIALDRENSPPQTGWFALVRLPAGSVTPAQLSIRPGNMELLKDGNSIPGTPYLVYSVDAYIRRSDWHQIEELKLVYEEFRDAVNHSNQTLAEQVVKQFRRRAVVCAELLPSHADEVAKAVEAEYKAAFPGGAVVNLIDSQQRHFKDLSVKFSDPAKSSSDASQSKK
ncbi:MAG: hypothetical protein ACREJO_15610 [Phycisphaerales bacterium]